MTYVYQGTFSTALPLKGGDVFLTPGKRVELPDSGVVRTLAAKGLLVPAPETGEGAGPAPETETVAAPDRPARKTRGA
ncbi:MAG: hypothetical protein GX580_02880 [Candidatus Hydrogenedens sp.]|nr:hypothetical protein [Candidatus Hydrogenedentota bacterium]NLF56563.1 hypothetical protein [Candidatus Hydrogenedens sp.]